MARSCVSVSRFETLWALKENGVVIAVCDSPSILQDVVSYAKIHKCSIRVALDVVNAQNLLVVQL